MIERFADSAAQAAAASEAILTRLREGWETRGRASLLVTGGRSPGPVYDALSRSRTIDWTRVVVTLSDERICPPTSPQSNARLVRERLLTHEAARAAFVPLWTGEGEPEAAARAAEPAIRALMPFDAALLGMGEDGHVASLFPGRPAGREIDQARLAMTTPEGLGDPPLARITLTRPALLASRLILILIAGARKRQVLEQALAGEDLPVRDLVAQDEAPVRVLWTP